MSTTWPNLPNAKYIDAVLAHLKANPEKWSAARDAARVVAGDAARDAAWDAARVVAGDAAWVVARIAAGGAVWDAAWDAARVVAGDAAWGARSAILALIAYDDCAYLLSSDVSELRDVIASSGEANPAAILLLPAVMAMQGELVV